MARVLISFIGKGRPVPSGGDSSRSGYARTTYRFPAEAGLSEEWEDRTSLFPSALVRRMAHLGRPVDCWLMMGTRQS